MPHAVLLGAAAAWLAAAVAARQPLPQALAANDRPVETFPLSRIRLLDGPFKHAEGVNLEYLHALEVDRLVAPFRTEAGLEPKGEKYPNWESTGLQGHTAGHYLTALAQAWAATGDAEAKRRLDYMVGELALCQRANGNGYVGGIPGSRELWSEIGAGNLRAERFGLNGKWVPWYNLHKLFAGLRDAHAIGGNAQARDVLVALAAWCATVVSKLTDAQMQSMLVAEHGGMNEVLADVAALTGDRSYVALAQRFSDRSLLEPLRRREDTLTGLHANTQIPKAIGYARIAELSGDQGGVEAARFFWDTVVGRRTVAFGGNSVREHFNPPDNFGPMLESREGPETCNTYNMLRLTERLFRSQPAARYADYYERALFNHILSTQHPEHGGYVYFTPIRPQHYRVYSRPSTSFWCCVGTGMENHGKYGEFIYAHRGDELFVNLFVASVLEWPEHRLVIRQETTFPDTPATRLVVSTPTAQSFTMHVRHPGWVAATDFRLRVNGRAWPLTSQPSTYAAIAREWRDGDTVEIALPMRTSAERLPDGSDYVAFVHGPILLAAKTGTNRLDGLLANDGRMAHASPGPYLPLDAAPMVIGSPGALPARVRPVPGRALTFRMDDIVRPASAKGLELIPFFRVHDSRYMMYWRAVEPAAYAGVVSRLRHEEEARLALEARTLDRVVPGEQQPEVEHKVRSDGSATGTTLGRTWRDASGFFSYELQAPRARGPLALQVTYFGADRDRRFDLTVNDRLVAAVSLDGGAPDRFVDVTYAIPADVVDAAVNGVLVVRFAAKSGSRAGAVYDLRLLAPK